MVSKLTHKLLQRAVICLTWIIPLILILNVNNSATNLCFTAWS